MVLFVKFKVTESNHLALNHVYFQSSSRKCYMRLRFVVTLTTVPVIDIFL